MRAARMWLGWRHRSMGRVRAVASPIRPTLKSFEAVGESGREALEADLLRLIAQFNRATDGTMVVPSEYLEAVIITR